MTRITIALAAALIAVPLGASAEASWESTGPRGGTVSGSGDCAAADGTLSCARGSTLVTPFGKTFTREAARTSSGGVTVKEFTTTGPRGGRVETTRTRVRN